MTQLFTEDGALTPVTVIEAGPCPVVAGEARPERRLRRRPARLRGGAARKRLNKPEIGHLAKGGIEPHRHLHEFRGADELAVGDVVTVEGFEPGDEVKVTGRSSGKGFAGTIKRHNFGRGPVSHGSHNVRAPGSIGQSATPSRVFKGMRMSGHMGDETRDAARPAGHRPRRRAQPAARHGRRARAERRPRLRAGGRLMAAPPASSAARRPSSSRRRVRRSSRTSRCCTRS